jgi:hemerythrin-like metal-binding protein
MISWKSCYDIGIATFDDEHHQLVGAINQLYGAMREKRADVTLEGLLQDLIHYTEIHFAHEEEVMDRYRFDAVDLHCSEHRQLVDKIKQFQQDLKQGKERLSAEVMTFLRNWLLDHIVETDMALGRFLRDQGIYDCGPPKL